MEKKQKTLLIIGIVVLAVLVAAFGFIWGMTRPETFFGWKTIDVTVDYGDGTIDEFHIHTRAKYLREAVEQEITLEGVESEFGMYIQSVNGVTADESLQQWWCITKRGQSVMTGINEIPIADGNRFELTLVTGW